MSRYSGLTHRVIGPIIEEAFHAAEQYYDTERSILDDLKAAADSDNEEEYNKIVEEIDRTMENRAILLKKMFDLPYGSYGGNAGYEKFVKEGRGTFGTDNMFAICDCEGFRKSMLWIESTLNNNH